jgi:hypothetical protein
MNYFNIAKSIVTDDLKRKGIHSFSIEDIVWQASAVVQAYDLLEAQDKEKAESMWELVAPLVSDFLDRHNLPELDSFFPDPNKQIAARAVLVKRGHGTDFDYIPIFETYRDRADAILREVLNDPNA